MICATSLYCTIYSCNIVLKYIVMLILKIIRKSFVRLFENYLSVNRSSMNISYRNNIFNNGFSNFSAILTIFNSFDHFKVCTTAPFSEILCRVEASYLTFNEIQLTGFMMMRVFTERCVRADFHFSLNVNVDVTIVINMNRNSNEIKLHSFLPFLKQIHRSCFSYILLLCIFEA